MNSITLGVYIFFEDVEAPSSINGCVSDSTIDKSLMALRFFPLHHVLPISMPVGMIICITLHCLDPTLVLHELCTHEEYPSTSSIRSRHHCCSIQSSHWIAPLRGAKPAIQQLGRKLLLAWESGYAHRNESQGEEAWYQRSMCHMINGETVGESSVSTVICRTLGSNKDIGCPLRFGFASV